MHYASYSIYLCTKEVNGHFIVKKHFPLMQVFLGTREPENMFSILT